MDAGNKQTCWLYRLGLISYKAAWVEQKKLVEARRRQADLPDSLLLLEHPPVYTLGQGADEQFVKFEPTQHTPPVIRVERGGEVTYHCPGQLVGYPIMNLRRHRTDLHWYLRQLEEVLIRTLQVFDLAAERVPNLTGVWVDGCKVAAIGIKASRWITMHGFALNVCPDLAGFERIVPCGIAHRRVGSLAQFRQDLTVAQVQSVLEKKFEDAFQCELVAQAPSMLT